MASNTKFTVVIPTRERVSTLRYALETILRQDYDNLEIIVSDNASTDGTAEAVRSISDPRLRYINTGRRVSMSHNFEFGLSHVKGGWVTVVGDDDGLLPGALATVDEVIRSTGCEALTSDWCVYRWPDPDAVDPREHSSQLTVPISNGVEVRDSRAWLRRLMAYEAAYPQLPMLYTGGFVSTDVVDRARDPEGRFYRSRIPDVYSAIAIASVTESYVALRKPVAIAGSSPHSTGRALLGRTSHGAAGRLFQAEDNIAFHHDLGAGFQGSIDLLVYESYLQAASLHGDELVLSLPEQLALILSRLTGDMVHQTVEYIRGIATSHRLVMSDLETHALRLARRRAWRRYARTARYVLLERRVETTAGGANVLDASVAAKAIHDQSLATGHWWRLDQAKQLVVAKYRRWLQGR